MLVKFGGLEVHGGPMIGAGWHLKRFVDEMRSHKATVPYDGYRRMISHLTSFNMCCRAAGVKPTPKSHQIGHLVCRTKGEAGNVRGERGSAEGMG
eukprot:7177927-Pyramimonas_sp.AAC.1